MDNNLVAVSNGKNHVEDFFKEGLSLMMASIW
jgi:hypothetical protein